MRDSSGVFSICSLVRISMTSFPLLHCSLHKQSCLSNKKILTVAWRYEFYFLAVKKQYFTHSLCSFVKCWFYPSKIKFISSRRRVKFSPYLKRFSCEKACKHFRECSWFVLFTSKTSPCFSLCAKNDRLDWLVGIAKQSDVKENWPIKCLFAKPTESCVSVHLDPCSSPNQSNCFVPAHLLVFGCFLGKILSRPSKNRFM